MSCIPINDFSLITLCDATKAGKLYSIVPDSGAGDFDVVRASTATYLGSDGLIKTAANNEPRIEFNPDGTYKGLLVEPAATNFLLRSEEFDDAYWSKIRTTITANSIAAPNSLTTGDSLIETAVSGTHFIRGLNLSFTSGVSYVYSVFIKKNTRTKVRLALFDGVSDFASSDFDLVDLTSTNITGTSTMQMLANDWVRCSVIGTANNTTAVGISFIYLRNALGDLNYLGDGTSGVFAWGAQLETGSVATSYIPTVASTVTRAADVISKTGISSLIGQQEGTVYAEGNIRNLGGVRPVLAISDGSNNNRILINSFVQSGNTNLGIAANFASGSTVTLNNPTTTLGTFKVAVAYSGTEMVIYVNGVATSPATTTGFGNFSIIGIGQNTANSVQLNDHIKAAALLPTRLSNAQLEALTTL